MIMTDDQGYGDLACHGNPIALTPNLDQLHDESIRLTDFHAAPMCTPTRGQLMTGLDAARNGAVNVSSGRTLLRADLTTLADLFQANGYRTGVFGKWHLGDNYPYRPEDRGFEEALWFPSSHISSLPDYWENDYFDDVYHRNGTRLRYQGYCTQVFFREAKSWMKARIENDEPFFTYLPTNAPHGPLFVPVEDRLAAEAAFEAGKDRLPKLSPERREDIIRFLAMIRNLDSEIGQLRDFLREEEIERDTFLIFMTDNGSTFGPIYYNAGMRGGKCTLWEGGHRVPCFLHWPEGDLGEPRDVAGLTQMQDILPTLRDLCGLQDERTTALDGISLAPVLREEAIVPENRAICVNYSRMPRFDYPSPDSESIIRREGAAVLWKNWRYLEAVALYDLETDPAQEHNIIDQHPDIAKQMETMLNTWWQRVEPYANEIQYITIGSDQENPMMLTACEWKDVFVDQQKQVRIGERKNSYWHLEIERAGTYQFELRRWPEESDLHLREACPPVQLTDGYLEGGVSLPIARARMMMHGEWFTQEVEPGAESAVFTLELEPGRELLHTWFDDDCGQPICGAYYVYVKRLEN
jgi:arylsulfatase